MSFKQAVVLIHGIGEQRPMASLRSFAKGVAPEQKLFSQPDRMSQSFELRSLRSVGSETRTDFYEYYWAYKITDTTRWHLLGWMRTLLVRVPWRVPRHLLGLYALTWLGLIAACFVVGTQQAWPGYDEARAVSSSVGWVLVSLGALAQAIAVNYLGDAARYLSPLPSSVALRQDIRADGIRLLRALHAAGYDRIVVVGHSLGSVIGYDILTHLWADIGGRYADPKHGAQDALARLEAEGIALANGVSEKGDESAFQTLQHALFEEDRALGAAWRVTDFVTLGSPLAHAAILLADDEADLRARTRDRELPTCPPEPEDVRGPFEDTARKRYAYWPWFWKRTKRAGEPKHWHLHHAALFAQVRWTNFFFPARFGAFGDVVGGPLKRVFGPGIRDVAIRSGFWRGLRAWTPICHVDYWQKANREGECEARIALVSTLALEHACPRCAAMASECAVMEEEVFACASE